MTMLVEKQETRSVVGTIQGKLTSVCIENILCIGWTCHLSIKKSMAYG